MHKLQFNFLFHQKYFLIWISVPCYFLVYFRIHYSNPTHSLAWPVASEHCQMLVITLDIYKKQLPFLPETRRKVEEKSGRWFLSRLIIRSNNFIATCPPLSTAATKHKEELSSSTILFSDSLINRSRYYKTRNY